MKEDKGKIADLLISNPVQVGLSGVSIALIYLRKVLA